MLCYSANKYLKRNKDRSIHHNPPLHYVVTKLFFRTSNVFPVLLFPFWSAIMPFLLWNTCGKCMVIFTITLVISDYMSYFPPPCWSFVLEWRWLCVGSSFHSSSSSDLQWAKNTTRPSPVSISLNFLSIKFTFPHTLRRYIDASRIRSVCIRSENVSEQYTWWIKGFSFIRSWSNKKSKLIRRFEAPCDFTGKNTCSGYTWIDETRRMIGLVFR